MKKTKLPTRYSITGWWSQEGFDALTVIRDRAALVSIDNNHDFHGIITVDEKGNIIKEASILRDKNGAAAIISGSFDKDRHSIVFVKRYVNRRDDITYHANFHYCGFWYGDFEGGVVGQGKTKFVLNELPDDLFTTNVPLRRSPRSRSV